MRISDWSSDVCSSDLGRLPPRSQQTRAGVSIMAQALNCSMITLRIDFAAEHPIRPPRVGKDHGNQNRRTDQHEYLARFGCGRIPDGQASGDDIRSEEHTSELQSLMRISYAVFCLKKKNKTTKNKKII